MAANKEELFKFYGYFEEEEIGEDYIVFSKKESFYRIKIALRKRDNFAFCLGVKPLFEISTELEIKELATKLSKGQAEANLINSGLMINEIQIESPAEEK